MAHIIVMLLLKASDLVRVVFEMELYFGMMDVYAHLNRLQYA